MRSILSGLVIASAALAAALVSVPARADVLVVRSSGPSAQSYPPGRSLPDSAALALRTDDMVMILGSSGTRTFRGPGTFRVGAPVRMSPLARAMANQTPRSRIGAVRGEARAPAHAGVWRIDVTRGGTVCVADDTPLVLWRPDAAEAASLKIAGSTIAWSAGNATLVWPAAIPIDSGADYGLQLDPGSAPVRIRLVVIPAAPRSRIELAGALISHGCEGQLDRLLESLPVDESPSVSD